MLNWARAHGERINDRLFDRGEFLRYYKNLFATAAPADVTVLHLGAGRGTIGRTWRLFGEPGERRGLLIALDLDRDELRHNASRHRVHANAEALPLAPATVDVIVCEYVFEHLIAPARVLAECHRVLRRGGSLVFATPNKWSYVSAVARITPLWIHYLVSRLRGTPPSVMYETYYRLNTIAEISTAATAQRFEVRAIRTFVGEPNYTTFFPGVHYLFVLLHKLLERTPRLGKFGLDIVGVLVKC